MADSAEVRPPDLLDQVRAAQRELGSGSADEALLLVTPLLVRTRAALADLGFLRRSSADRRLLIEAFCYARVTAILALESVGAAEAVPRIRALAAEARDTAGGGTPGWKVQCAAAEMLGRCGDGGGALAAVTAAQQSAPDDEPYVRQVASSIQLMFPTT